MIKVEIDANSGFCGGVIRAIGTAERYLDEHCDSLYSLGAIVHNEEELSRLHSRGLVTIDDLSDLGSGDSRTILIRAHGEPPKVYERISGLGLHLIDCTCPVVLKLQKDIREAYLRLAPKGGHIVLYGKEGHPEVLGLVGQVDGDVTVVSSLEQLESLVDRGELTLDKDIELFSQTTMSPEGYDALVLYLQNKVPEGKLLCHNTICSQVASRHRELADFARNHDVIVFVAGSESSNGKILSELCRRENARTYNIGSEEDLCPEWFSDGDSVGVCGATSTPKWLLEKIARAIENLH